MRIRKNGTVVNLTESDLRRIVKRVITENENTLEGEKELSDPNTEKGKKIKLLQRVFPNFVGVKKSFSNAKKLGQSRGEYSDVVTGIKPLDKILINFTKKIANKDESEAEKDKESALSQIKNIKLPEETLNEQLSAGALFVMFFFGSLLLTKILNAMMGRR